MSARNLHPTSLVVIRDEHQHIATILRSMLQLMHRMGDTKESSPAELKLFRALLYYINEFPERMHHPKEEQYLFAKIKERTHQLDADLNRLTQQHSEGDQLAHQLQTALTRYEFNSATALPPLRELTEHYCQFYFNHIDTEEKHIIPIALQVLSDADWQSIDQAFAENQQTLDQLGHRYEVAQLFAAIRQIEACSGDELKSMPFSRNLDCPRTQTDRTPNGKKN